MKCGKFRCSEGIFNKQNPNSVGLSAKRYQKRFSIITNPSLHIKTVALGNVREKERM
jgi:hypothetical protein